MDLVGDAAALLLLRNLQAADEILQAPFAHGDLLGGSFGRQARLLLPKLAGGETRDVALHVLGHLVENGCQDGRLTAPVGTGAAREIAASERCRVRGEAPQRIGDAPGEQPGHQDRRRQRHHAKPHIAQQRHA